MDFSPLMMVYCLLNVFFSRYIFNFLWWGVFFLVTAKIKYHNFYYYVQDFVVLVVIRVHISRKLFVSFYRDNKFSVAPLYDMFPNDVVSIYQGLLEIYFFFIKTVYKFVFRYKKKKIFFVNLV